MLLLAIAFSLLLFSGCTDEKEVVKTETVVEKDTVYVSIIAVDAINVDMDSVTQGLPIQLTIQITKGSQVGDVTINWFATGGHFDSESGDTVTWTSPDDPGVYTVTAHVTDGQYIGIGSRMVGVGMYVPTTTPYYLGADACGGCHAQRDPDIWNGWSNTLHAHAWENLQNSGHARESCNHCHTVDFNETPGNSGFDDAPIEKFVNVQCENCHGAGSAHIAGGNPDPTKISISYEATLCGNCHTGDRYPQYDEWQLSLHGNSLENHAVGISSCLGCHEGVGGAIRLEGDLSSFYGSGSVGRPDTSEFALADIGCATCHDPHSVDNEHQLRTVADVVLVPTGGVSPVISDGGLGKLCMQCHHARESADDNIPEGASHFGTHHSTQADVLAAETGYKDVAPAGFNWAGPSHLLIENSCITCHMYSREYISATEPKISGHTFEPKVEACARCHGTINDFEDIPASADFDGDGVVEGLELEVDGLVDLLTEALVADGLDTTGGVGLEGALGDTLRSTYTQREAGFNLVMIESDGSHGFHNPDYVVQLLQQSLQYITGQLPPNAVVVKNDNEVVSNW